MKTRERIDASQLDIKDNVVSINRVTKVVKGGKNLSFSALVVVGDGHGVVGFGVGKVTTRAIQLPAGAEVREHGDVPDVPRFKLETLSLPLDMLAGRLSGAGVQLMQRLAEYRHFAVWVQACRAESAAADR